MKLFMLQLQQVNMNMAVFWQGGALPHWAIEVHDFLKKTFSDKWCRRGGPIRPDDGGSKDL
jgi:hypothetical protein